MTVKMLLVEDRPQVWGLVLDLLSTVGDFTLAKAVSTEAEANLWLEENPGQWDLAVVDLVLEQGTGLGVLARARQHARGAKIVVFSEYITQGMRKHCLELGADEAFQKSTDTKAFVDYCAGVAASRRRDR
ncbi:response regulator [Caenimonas terrae]|uniref:Response regulator n=1 Tax=Caenimonas terrae TaxID=696074 RepID=A0ABW0NBB3_9BURK